MPVEYPGGGPPDWWTRFLAAAEAFLRDRWADTREMGLLTRDAVRRLAEDLRGGARRRWPAARARVRAAHHAIGRAAHRGWDATRAASARGAAAARTRLAGLREGLGPAAHRALDFARAHAPSRRVVIVGALLAGAATWGLWERCGIAGCPDVSRIASYQPGGASVLLDLHGEPFADLAPMEYEVVPLAELPPYVGQAFVAVEDKRFYEHGGVDWRRVAGALLADIKAMAPVQGSSTLPMQLARTLFPDRIPRAEKSFARKLLEARMARELEDAFTKDELLELYLNHVYLGAGMQGVQSASRYYFGKDAADLDVEEAAMLAALPKAPAHYDPRAHPEAARARRNLVLTLMERQALLTPDEAEDARASMLHPADAPERPGRGRLAPYFVQTVRRMLEEAVGADLYTRRLRVLTTLDPRLQRAAEEELETQLRAVERGTWGRLSGARYDAAAPPSGDATAYLQGAVVSMDVHTGDVRAWVGGRDFDHSRFDRAALARRQAGSAFKPFVYAAALEEGFAASQPILDAPYRLAGGGGRVWSPRNYDGGFEGPMSMREALVRSQNVPAVRLAAAVGPRDVADLAARAGLSGDVPASPVAALGVTAVSPLEMATAFSAFAAEGVRVAPRFVLRVEDADGTVLWEAGTPERTRSMGGDVAWVMTDMLREVVERGTATAVRRAGWWGPAAGKTGTTSDATDVWFVGYTPELVTSVWVGFDDVRPLPGRASGGGVAAPVFGRMMARTFRGGEVADWPRAPGNITALWVDPSSGMALEDDCLPRSGTPRREVFIRGSEPPETCPRREYRSFGDRVGRWLEDIFGGRRDRRDRSDRWEDDDRGREPDPDLGTPRLPTRESGRRGEER